MNGTTLPEEPRNTVLSFAMPRGPSLELVLYDGGGHARSYAILRIVPRRTPVLIVPAGEC